MTQRGRRTMTECLRPLLTSMRLFGLYFSRQLENAGDNPDKKSRKWNVWMIYAVVVVVLLWVNAVRMFSVFTSEDKFDVMLLSKILNVIWMIQCAISQTVFHTSSYSGALQSVFLKMKLSDECAIYLRKIAIVYTAVVWSLITMGSAFFVYGFFFTVGFMDVMVAPFQIHFTSSNLLVVQIVVYFFSFYLLSAQMFPQAMTFLLAMLVSFQFRRVNAALDSCLESRNRLVEDSEIETFRQQHQEISMSVSRIDDCLMFSNASAFCCQLSGLILILYTLIFYHSSINDPIIITGFVFWMIIMSVGLTFTAAAGIMVNHYVSELRAVQ